MAVGYSTLSGGGEVLVGALLVLLGAALLGFRESLLNKYGKMNPGRTNARGTVNLVSAYIVPLLFVIVGLVAMAVGLLS